ncbi:type II toxin-antitoxin system RelE/ParE family toxin [Dryocola clanedunensis]
MFTLAYHPEVVEELAALSPALKGKMLRLLTMLSEKGNALRFPHTSPLRHGLFELRASGSDIARTIFIYQSGKTIWVLRTFIKKSEKTPAGEIRLAIKRLEEMVNA